MKMQKFKMFITAVTVFVLFLIKLQWPKNESFYDTAKFSLRGSCKKGRGRGRGRERKARKGHLTTGSPTEW